MKLISLIFSFKNEEKNIQELIDRVSKTLSQLKDRWNYEMIFVNDASTDKSEQILIELQNKYPITIINMSRTFGVGPCVLAGFKESKGDAIIYMDSDLQDPPELIKDLITEHEKGFDVVHTVRSKRLGEPWLKLFLTKIAYKVINFLSDVPLPVEAGDFKLISRTALDKILKQKEFRPYIRGLSVWVGFKQGFINYIRDARHQGQTKFPLLSHGPINQFISGVTAYSLKPLYLAIIFGIFAFFLSLILMIYALYTKLSGLSVPGTSGILITISFFSGVILFCIGIMGIYLARIFEEVRGRDSYIIKNIIKKN
jgi:glycosyltransferase involved in cell wall biosynthesis